MSLTDKINNMISPSIEKQAHERFERLIEGMKQTQGITEQLKAEYQLEWVQRLNNIRACAREVVNEENRYSHCFSGGKNYVAVCVETTKL